MTNLDIMKPVTFFAFKRTKIALKCHLKNTYNQKDIYYMRNEDNQRCFQIDSKAGFAWTGTLQYM